MFLDLVDGLMGLPDQALDDRIGEIELERRRLDTELAAAVRVAEQRRLGAVDGHRTINSYLRATLNSSNADASRLQPFRRRERQPSGLRPGWRVRCDPARARSPTAGWSDRRACRHEAR
jgi:hypothetical protein